jgi:molybdate transport system substrate-binding protein
MSTLNILSGGAAHGLVASLTPAFKAQTGFDIAGEFGAVGVMADKLRKGPPADIIILTAALVAKLAEEKLVVAASMTDVGLVETAVAKVLQQLGVADEVATRLRIFPNGATAMRELAASEARRPLGCTQSTEIISTKGVILSGSLPPGCELATMYTAGIATTAAHPQQAQNLIDLLTGAGQLEQRTRAGFIGGGGQAPA